MDAFDGRLFRCKYVQATFMWVSLGSSVDLKSRLKGGPVVFQVMNTALVYF